MLHPQSIKKDVFFDSHGFISIAGYNDAVSALKVVMPAPNEHYYKMCTLVITSIHAHGRDAIINIPFPVKWNYALHSIKKALDLFCPDEDRYYFSDILYSCMEIDKSLLSDLVTRTLQDHIDWYRKHFIMFNQKSSAQKTTNNALNNWQNNWQVNLNTCTVRHIDGLVIKFSSELCQGEHVDGHIIAGIKSVRLSDISRLVHQAMELFQSHLHET